MSRVKCFLICSTFLIFAAVQAGDVLSSSGGQSTTTDYNDCYSTSRTPVNCLTEGNVLLDSTYNISVLKNARFNPATKNIYFSSVSGRSIKVTQDDTFKPGTTNDPAGRVNGFIFSGALSSADTLDVLNNCIRMPVTTAARPRFIPMKYASEWASYINSLPASGAGAPSACLPAGTCLNLPANSTACSSNTVPVTDTTFSLVTACPATGVCNAVCNGGGPAGACCPAGSTWSSGSSLCVRTSSCPAYAGTTWTNTGSYSEYCNAADKVSCNPVDARWIAMGSTDSVFFTQGCGDTFTSVYQFPLGSGSAAPELYRRSAELPDKNMPGLRTQGSCLPNVGSYSPFMGRVCCANTPACGIRCSGNTLCFERNTATCVTEPEMNDCATPPANATYCNSGAWPTVSPDSQGFCASASAPTPDSLNYHGEDPCTDPWRPVLKYCQYSCARGYSWNGSACQANGTICGTGTWNISVQKDESLVSKPSAPLGITREYITSAPCGHEYFSSSAVGADSLTATKAAILRVLQACNPNAAMDTTSSCGDQICDMNETGASVPGPTRCPTDCKSPTCGDGICQSVEESTASKPCPIDCGQSAEQASGTYSLNCCPDDKVWDGTACVSCPNGYYRVAGANPQTCPAGYYYQGSCAAGYYCNGSSSCW
ncbi:MAG: hypothetical protein HQL20_06655 [Candidatus Omnitrophica bacterium]|nr:hypothetical protein [Candidatus Omnitrophota bacterium]